MHLRTLILIVGMSQLAVSQPAGTLYDEAGVPKYTLPEALVLNSGKPVRDTKTWTDQRRPELLALYTTEVFGRSPSPPAKLNYEVTSIDQQALGGRAIRKLVRI